MGWSEAKFVKVFCKNYPSDVCLNCMCPILDFCCTVDSIITEWSVDNPVDWEHLVYPTELEVK